MARIDKYDPVDGGFRAPLAADRTGAAAPIGVGLDSNGRVVAGAGNTGIIAVVCKPDDAPAGTPMDCMTDGELVEFAGAAGTSYTANTTTGVISSAAPSATQVPIGFTVEATRLIVRTNRSKVFATAVVGDQAAIADVATADATDLASAEALANANKAKINEILAMLRTAGVLTP